MADDDKRPPEIISLRDVDLELPSVSDPLAECIEIIDALIGLCSKHGFRREALSIALGVDIPRRPKRGPGQPKKKDATYRLGLGLAAALGERAGLRRAAVARVWAESALGDGATRADLKAKAAQVENDLTVATPRQRAIAAFIVNEIDSGRPFNEIEERWPKKDEPQEKQ